MVVEENAILQQGFQQGTPQQQQLQLPSPPSFNAYNNNYNFYNNNNNNNGYNSINNASEPPLNSNNNNSNNNDTKASPQKGFIVLILLSIGCFAIGVISLLIASAGSGQTVIDPIWTNFTCTGPWESSFEAVASYPTDNGDNSFVSNWFPTLTGRVETSQYVNCAFTTYFTEEFEIISQQLTYNFEYNSAGYIACISISDNNEEPTQPCSIQQSEQFYSPCAYSTSDPSSCTNYYEWNGTGTHYFYIYPSDTVVANNNQFSLDLYFYYVVSSTTSSSISINSSLFVFIACVTFLIAFFAFVFFAFLKVKRRNATANQQQNL